MKKTTAILLLLLVFLSQLGYYLFYIVQQHEIKEEMERQLLARVPESQLEVIVADDCGQKLQWIEEGKEFSFNGEMYDVVKIEKRQGKTFLYCINDRKETEVCDRLSNAVKDDIGHQTAGGNRVLKFHALYHQVIKTGTVPDIIFYSKLHYCHCASVLLSPFMEINGPPPKA